MSAWRTIRAGHAPLAWFAVAMVVVGAVSAVGYAADPRVLVGAPIWAKPLKFSISFAVYAVTLAWMISLLRRPRLQKLARRTGTVLAVASAVEMTAIVGQVIRGQRSHFNETTPFNAAVYAVMGATVVVIFTCTVVVAVAVVMTPLADRAVTWAVRLGLGLSLAGMAVGFLMVVPRAAQLRSSSKIVGAHSVGTPDGGPGLPFLGWSTTGGDLRIAHFIGMHALQALPLFALALTLLPAAARLTARSRVCLVFVAAGVYAGIVAITLWQALRGESIVHPSPATTLAAVVLLAASFIGLVAVSRTARRDHRHNWMPHQTRRETEDTTPATASSTATS
ncbi:hypothetical protein ACXR2U_03100 [Jatrophihabitans sp. YIM 134969]